jgi:glycosyltransferase involved in cell wall biosynthesis
MNIYIPFDIYTSVGGPSTFMMNLKEYLDVNAYKYLIDPQKASAMFFPIKFNERVIKSIKKRNGGVIQRLDGIFYPSKHGNIFEELNKEIRSIYLNYSDHVIFQSKYSKKQCFNMFGEINENNYSIIFNGVNKKIFYPNNKIIFDDKYKLVTTGNFRNIDMLEPAVKALDKLANTFNFEFHIVGPVVDESLKEYLKRDYIIYHGILDSAQVAQLLRKSDIFIYSHLNPPCPNSVIEAMSTGLPIVGFDSGSMKELCWFSNDLLAFVSEDTFQKYEDFNYNLLAEKLKKCIKNYSYYRTIALDHAYLYSFEECGAKYVEVFKKIILEKTNGYEIKVGKGKANINGVQRIMIKSFEILNSIIPVKLFVNKIKRIR